MLKLISFIIILFLLQPCEILAVSQQRIDPQVRALIDAIAAKDINKVQTLINAGVNINATNEYNRTPLIEAIDRQSLEIVKLLLDAGAKTDSDNSPDPIYYAAKYPDILKAILATGPRINNKNGECPALCAAAKDGVLESVKLLLEMGAKIDGNYQPPLEEAAKNGHIEVVRYLLSAGANINYQYSHCDTALMSAAANGHQEIVKFLLENGADVNLRNHNLQTALMMAINASHQEIVELLKNRGADFNNRDKTVAYDAIQFAQQFAFMLEGTHDFAPLVDKLFISNFPTHCTYTTDGGPVYTAIFHTKIDAQLYKTVDKAIIREYCIATLNYFYLSTIHYYSTYDDEEPKGDYKPLAAVERILAKNPAIKKGDIPKSVAEFKQTFNAYKQINNLYQSYIRTNPPEKNPLFLKNLNWMDKSGMLTGKFYQRVFYNFEYCYEDLEESGNAESLTPVIVNVPPFFQIAMIKFKQGFKIIRVDSLLVE